jgi:tRNA nucleotidyltransferase (CCA-adding enzyme)
MIQLDIKEKYDSVIPDIVVVQIQLQAKSLLASMVQEGINVDEIKMIDTDTNKVIFFENVRLMRQIDTKGWN